MNSIRVKHFSALGNIKHPKKSLGDKFWRLSNRPMPSPGYANTGSNRALHQSYGPHEISQCLIDAEHRSPAKKLEIGFSYIRVIDLNMEE